MSSEPKNNAQGSKPKAQDRHLALAGRESYVGRVVNGVRALRHTPSSVGVCLLVIACAPAQPGESDPQPSDTITREEIAAHNADFAIDIIRDLRPRWVRGLTRDAAPTRTRRCLATYINGAKVGFALPRTTSQGTRFTPVEDRRMGKILSKDVVRIEHFEPGLARPDGFPSDSCYAIHFVTR